jgi:hypothetical protein
MRRLKVNVLAARAADLFEEQHSNLHGRVNAAGHETSTILSREELERKFLTIRQSAYAGQEALYQKNILTARAIAAIAADSLREHAIELEASEKDRFTRYGLPYTGSPLVNAVRNAEKFVRARVQPDVGANSPAVIMPWLII